jgi:putative ABC transport system ATP-binding protein
MTVAAPAQESIAVQIRQLSYYFGRGDLRKQVLYDIDLDLPPGQIVIMTGPSGSGKTTLLTLIGALRSVQDGSLQVLGKKLPGWENASWWRFAATSASSSRPTTYLPP